MRPIYETSQDRLRQHQFLEEIERETHWKITEAPRSYHVEGFAQANGKAVAVIEVKNRMHNHGTYKTVILAMLKVRVGMAFAGMLGVPFIFCVKWKDGPWGMFNFDEHDVRDLRIDFEGGRTVDKRDPADVEPVFHLPLYGFKMHGIKQQEKPEALGYCQPEPENELPF